MFFGFLATSQSFPTTGEALINATASASVNGTTLTTMPPQHQTTLFNISAANNTFTNHTMSQTNGGGTTLTITICVIIGSIVLLSIAYCIYRDHRSKKGTIYEGESCC